MTIGKIRHKIKRALQHSRTFFRTVGHYRTLQAHPSPRFSIQWRDRHLCLRDATSTTGFDRHYVYHTAWAARMVAEYRPPVHVDIAGSLYFAGLVSAFIPVRFIDFRPARLGLAGLSSEPGDIHALPFADKSITSLSCMHVLEHIGLARYGDPLDYDGDIKAANELKRVLAPDGQLLIVVPMGGESLIQFNAHRIYRKSQIVDMFSPLVLKRFFLIHEREADGGIVENPTQEQVNRERYGCGCFVFVREQL